MTESTPLPSAKKAKAEIRNWYKDRYQYVVVQRKIMAAITVAALLSTLVALLVIWRLIPLKTIEPYVIQVDQKTGITQVVDPLSVKQLTANESVNNFFIVRYIRAREGYAQNTLLSEYDAVRILSDPGIYRAFTQEADPNNPKSNITRLGAAGQRAVKFKSISYLGDKVAQARVLVEEKTDGLYVDKQYHKIVTLSFEYAKMELTPEERYVNPLGFRVTEYRIDEDVLQQ